MKNDRKIKHPAPGLAFLVLVRVDRDRQDTVTALIVARSEGLPTFPSLTAPQLRKFIVVDQPQLSDVVSTGQQFLGRHTALHLTTENPGTVETVESEFRTGLHGPYPGYLIRFDHPIIVRPPQATFLISLLDGCLADRFQFSQSLPGLLTDLGSQFLSLRGQLTDLLF